MTHPVTASLIIELNVTISGNYIPYVPATGPSYASGGEPAEGDYCEDVAIDGLTVEVADGWTEDPSNGKLRKSRSVDILADVDTSSPEVQKLLANILACVEEEAQNELRDAAGDDDGREYEPEDDREPDTFPDFDD